MMIWEQEQMSLTSKSWFQNHERFSYRGVLSCLLSPKARTDDDKTIGKQVKKEKEITDLGSGRERL